MRGVAAPPRELHACYCTILDIRVKLSPYSLHPLIMGCVVHNIDDVVHNTRTISVQYMASRWQWLDRT